MRACAMKRVHCFRLIVVVVVLFAAQSPLAADEVIRSAKSGPWSDGATWVGGKLPAAGARVLVRPGHTVVYDAENDVPIRAVQIGGTLTFARYTDTLLN